MASGPTPMMVTPILGRALPTVQLRGKIEFRLATQVGKQGIRPGDSDDLGRVSS